MSYDIFGKPLSPGNCEVHPWIAQEYPCDKCRDDKQRYDEDRANDRARREYERGVRR